MRIPVILATACMLAAAGKASAHVVLAQRAAPVSSYYKASFQVGHGCEGSATIAIRVDIPDGIAVAKPQPKPGWHVTTERGPLTQFATVHGKTVTEGVRSITWRGGPLADDQFDEFGAMLLLPAQPGRLHFRVLQTCEQGAIDWAGMPEPGGDHPRAPAATLDVFDPAEDGADDRHAQSARHHHGHIGHGDHR